MCLPLLPHPISLLGAGARAVPAGAAPRWCQLCRLTQGITLPGTAASGTGWAGPVALSWWQLSHAECLSVPADSVLALSHRWGN